MKLLTLSKINVMIKIKENFSEKCGTFSAPRLSIYTESKRWSDE